MSEQAFQKVFFVALCAALVFIFSGLGLMMFASGPTGDYHIRVADHDGTVIATLYQDRLFWDDIKMFRGTPTEAWELYWRITEAAND